MMSDAIEVLGWTLLHFVWQGAVVGVLAAILLAALRRRSANARYLAAVAALGLMLLLPLGTIAWIEHTSPPGEVSPIVMTTSTIEIPRTRDDSTLALDEPLINVEHIGIDFENPPPTDAKPLKPVSDKGQTLVDDLPGQRSAFRVESFLKPIIPWAVGVWLIGVGILSLRLFASWWSVRRLRCHSTQPAGESWQALLRQLSERLRVTRPVKLVESALVEVPAVIGWLRPIILLPATAMTGLTTEQLEALLAHELAHVRRHDYLINLLQTIVETLLFYHPAIWWLSHRIRLEREHCCDDLAASICGDRLTYAKALVAMEELRAPKLHLAMSSRGGSLLTRVARLLGPAEPQRQPTGWIAGLLMLVLLAMAGALGAGLLTPPEKPTEGLPNDRQPTTTKSDTNEETSGPDQRRGQETRAERVAAERGDVAKIVTGRVIDAMDKPVANAKVWLPIKLDRLASDYRTLSARTDEEGRFRIPVTNDDLEPNQYYRLSTLWAWAEGHSLSIGDAYRQLYTEQRARELEIKLGAPADTTVVVDDPKGVPLAGVIVEPKSYDTSSNSSDWLPSELSDLLRRTTDASGKAHLSAVRHRGLDSFRVIAPQFGTQTKRRDTVNSTQPVRLRATGKLVGKVEGAPPESLRDVVVVAATKKPRVPGNPGGYVESTEGYARVVLGPDGRFEIPVLAEGELKLHVISPLESPYRAATVATGTSSPMEAVVVASATETSVVVTMEKAVVVRGLVRAETSGEPLAATTVALSNHIGSLNVNASGRTDASGWYSVLLPPGRISKQPIAAPKGFGYPKHDRALIDIPRTDQPFELPVIELPPLKTKLFPVAGRLLDRTGRPIPDVDVFVADFGNYSVDLTDGAGNFSLETSRPIAQLQWIARQNGRNRHCVVKSTEPLVLETAGETLSPTLPPEIIHRGIFLEFEDTPLADVLTFAGDYLGLELFVDEDSLDRAGETLDLSLTSTAGETNLETAFATLLRPHKLRARFEMKEDQLVLFIDEIKDKPAGNSALGAGLLTPPDKPTAGLPNDTPPTSTKSNDTNEETSGPNQRRGQETRAERGAVKQGQFTGRVRLTTEKALPDLEKLVVPAGKVLDESLVFSKDGGLANVFVYLRKPTFAIEPPTEAELAKPFVLMVDSGKFWPHAAFVRVGRPVVLENGAAETMNIHTHPIRNNPVNVSVPPQGRIKAPAFDRSENIPLQVKNDLKPWMLAHLLTLDHPFAAITDDDGHFAINGLPPGEHEFRVWHERVGWLEKSLVITIKPGEDARSELEYAPDRLKLTEAEVLAWGKRLIDAKWIPQLRLPRPAAPPPKDEKQSKISNLKSEISDAKPDAAKLAIERGIAFLKSRQTDSGLWPEQLAPIYDGGVSSLCVLALLQAGAKPDETILEKTLVSLRKIKPDKTYTVALQTMVLCLASPKEDAELVRRNVTWLENAQATDGASRGGWSYQASKLACDGSNSRFAVMGLHAAKRAGFDVQDETWRRVSDYWVTSLKDRNGWGYTRDSGPSISMTLAGIASLAAAHRYLPRDDQALAREAAIRQPAEFVERGALGSEIGGLLYTAQCLERAGHVSGMTHFGKLEWKSDMTKRLLDRQQADGSWKSSGVGENNELIATSLALLALTGQPEPKQNARVERDAADPESRHAEGSTATDNDPESRQAIEAIERWRQATERLASYEAEFDRWEYDYVFNLSKRGEGTFHWQGADSWRLQLRAPKLKSDSVVNVKNWETGQLTPMKAESSSPESWNRVGAVITYLDETLPEGARNKQISFEMPAKPPDSNGFWGRFRSQMFAHFSRTPWFFPPPKDSQHKVHVKRQDDKELCLELQPRGDEAATYQHLTVILDRQTSLPRAVRLIDPAGTRETVLTYRETRIEWKKDREEK